MKLSAVTLKHLFAGLFAALVAITAAHAQDVFTGASYSDWSTPSNWSDGLPGSGADVVFDAPLSYGSSYSESFLDSSFSLNSLTFAANSGGFDLVQVGVQWDPSTTLSLTGPGIISSGTTIGDIWVTGASYNSYVNQNFSGSSLIFYGSSSSGHSTIENYEGYVSPSSAYTSIGGVTTFTASSNAGSSYIQNEGADDASVYSSEYGTVVTGGGSTQFGGASSASHAEIENEASASGLGSSGATSFGGYATAGNALILNEGANNLSTYHAYGGTTSFQDNSTAGSSEIINYGGEGNVGGGAGGGSTSFQGDSSAGNATLIAYGGNQGGNAGAFYFTGQSTGGSAVFDGQGGLFDISGNAVAVSVGAIEGTGNIDLGKQTLTIGSLNLNTTYSGIISDGGEYGGTGGGLIKNGSGTLVLAGANTYTGGTVIDAGTLQVDTGGSISHPNANLYSGFSAGDAGALIISNGGQVTDATGYVGYLHFGIYSPATSGAVMVTGSGSAWSNTSNLVVGNQGNGTLDIENGGVVSVAQGAGTVILASQAGSSGILNIGNGDLAGKLEASTLTGGAGTAQVNFGETDPSFAFAPNLTGSLSVTQSGSGTTILTGTNTYTGGTTVTAGRLAVNGSVTGNVSVSSGGTLGGSGTVGGKVTVAGGGSTYPGDPQILTAGSAEYQNGSTAQFSIATANSSSHPPTPGVDYDQIKLTSDAPQSLLIDPGTTTLQLNLSATSLAALQSNASDHINDLYFVFNLGSGISSGQFSDLTLTEGTNTYTDAITNGTATFAQLGLDFNLSYTASELNDSLSGGNDVAFGVTEAVPEPTTWAMLIGSLGVMAFRSLRARRARL